jgi:hypothetical protein
MRRVAQLVVACVLLAYCRRRYAKQAGQRLPSAGGHPLDQSYRLNLEPAKLPMVVKVLSQLGAFREPDSAGLYVGFRRLRRARHQSREGRQADQ